MIKMRINYFIYYQVSVEKIPTLSNTIKIVNLIIRKILS